MDRVLQALVKTEIEVEFRCVPAHVVVYDNERADRLTKAATTTKRAHRTAARTEIADAIVATITSR